ncbi:MAG: acyltransferase family protein [Lacibacter sp.]
MKITQLTFTRFLAAIAIVIFHFRKEVFPFSVDSIKVITGFLNVLVSYFFVLSGFILTINAKGKIELKQFYFNRFSRIYPVYIFALLFTLLLIFSIRQPSYTLDFNRTFLSVFLVQSWNFKYALVYNYPAWSLSAEAFFYLLFPLIYNLLQKLQFKKRLLIILVFWLIMQGIFVFFSSNRASFVVYNPFFHLSTFLMGILAGMLYREKYSWLVLHQKKLRHLFFISAILILFLMLTENKLFSIAYHNGLLAPFFILLIFMIAEDWLPFISWFGNRSPEYLGEISYGIYILQVPVYRLLTQTFNLDASISPTGLFYLFVLVLIIMSVVSYELIEKPSRVFLRNNFNRYKQM